MAREAGYTRGHEPSLGRDRGRDDRRPRGRHRLRADQDRRAVALGPRRQVQPAAAHRGAARRRRRVPRPLRLPRTLAARAAPEPARRQELRRAGANAVRRCPPPPPPRPRAAPARRRPRGRAPRRRCRAVARPRRACAGTASAASRCCACSRRSLYLYLSAGVACSPPGASHAATARGRGACEREHRQPRGAARTPLARQPGALEARGPPAGHDAPRRAALRRHRPARAN